MNILVINGPNINMLGKREPDKYGQISFYELEDLVREQAEKYDMDIDFFQSNSEGDIVDCIQKSAGYDGIILNAGAYTHTSIAIRDALLSINAKFIEVSSHPTARTWNKYMKEPFEDHSSWQGKVYYSRNGEPVQGYAEFESTCGYGQMLGISGINCYHQFSMNYTGESSATQYSEKEVEKQYALSQEQRSYERVIRQLKQAKAVYDEAGEKSIANSIGKSITMANNQLKNFCEKNNLKYYNWRTQI